MTKLTDYMERRDFLKISALTTGAVLTINPLSALAETMVSEETGMAESRPEGGYAPNPKIAGKFQTGGGRSRRDGGGLRHLFGAAFL